MSGETPTEGATSGPTIRFGKVALDTPDPRGLADFYAQVLGWQVDDDASDDEWVNLRGDGGALAFQLSKDHVPPTWPTGAVPQQFHIDLYVTAYDDAEQKVLALGATLLEASEDHPTWRVYADPAGHPFCLCLD